MARKRTSENELVVSSGPAAAPVRRKTATVVHKKHTATQPEIASPSAAKPSVEPVVPVVAVVEPTQEQIAAQAYLYWEARGYQAGSPEEDWLRAEQELRARSAAARAAIA